MKMINIKTMEQIIKANLCKNKRFGLALKQLQSRHQIHFKVKDIFKGKW